MPWLVVVLVPLLIFGGFVLRHKKSGIVSDPSVAEEVVVQDPSPTETPEETKTPTKPIVQVIDDGSPENTDWCFPGAEIEFQNDMEIRLKSKAAANEITTWYEAKLRTAFDSVSISKTNANGNINNVLAGNQIRIFITQNSGESYSQIRVQFR